MAGSKWEKEPFSLCLEETLGTEEENDKASFYSHCIGELQKEKNSVPFIPEPWAPNQAWHTLTGEGVSEA